ncbi:MAG: phage tail tape measure protein, partial [Alphaproteobacteria bacterium]
MANLDVALVLKLVDQFSQPLKVARTGLGKLKKDVGSFGRSFAQGAKEAAAGYDLPKATQKSQASFSRAKAGMMGAVGGALSLGLPIREAMAFQTAMANVGKVVDFEAPKGFAKMGRDILALTRQLPMAATDIAAIVAAGGQAGLAKKELLTYAEMAAKIGVAFDVSADQAGKAMANLKNSLELSLGETGLLADAMNYLSNKMATSAAQVLDVTLRVGAQAKMYGLSAKEVAAFGAAMVAAGAQSEIASTSLRNLGLKLTKGEAATKAQRTALAELGLEAVNVAKAMQIDASGTILDVFERIGALPDFKRASVSSLLLGDETRALGPLITNIGLLRQALGLVKTQSAFAGSAFQEYERQAATSANQLKIARNGLTETSIIIGTSLLPALNSASTRFNQLTSAFSAFAENNPKLSSALVKTGAGLLALSIVGRVGAFMFTGLRTALLGMVGLFTKLGPATAVLGKAFAGLRALAVPALAAITAAGWPMVAVGAAIAAAGVLLIQYWEPVKAFFAGLAKGLQPVFDGLAQILKPLAPLGNAVAAAFLSVGDAINGVVNWFARLTAPIEHTKAQLAEARSLGEQLGQALVKTFSDPIGAVGDLLASIGGLGNAIFKEFTGIDLAAEGRRILNSLWEGMKAVWARFQAWIVDVGASIAAPFSSAMSSITSLFGGGSAKGAPAAARGSGVGRLGSQNVTYKNNPKIS